MRRTRIRRNSEALHFMRNIYSEVIPDVHISTKLRVEKWENHMKLEVISSAIKIWIAQGRIGHSTRPRT